MTGDQGRPAVRLSVIIPFYNAEDTLGEQLEALCRQRWDEPWEVLAVDNRSTDRSREVAESFVGRLERLRVIDASERQGQPFALNRGAEQAGGRSLAFCDADDVVGDGWLMAIGDALERHEFVAGRWDEKLLNSETVRRSRAAAQSHGLQPYTQPPFLPHASGGTLAVRRELHMAIGGFDETLPLLHDTDYCWRLQLRGVPLVFVPDAVIHTRFRNTLRETYRQARGYGEYNVLLYKRYRDQGMPPADWRRGFRGWLRLAVAARSALRPEDRMRWVRRLGWHVGRVRGCLKHRVLAP
jgi:glycosyltransferase involved in cell wall biosynthesis